MANESKDTTVNSELYALQQRLGRIFLPQAMRQQSEAIAKSNTQDGSIRFIHYTSAEAALSIISSKCMWMRSTTCMSDYREVQHGFSILYGVFSDPVQRKSFIEALDACCPGAAVEAINIFDQWWKSNQLNIYIASFSEHDSKEDMYGRLSMWRAFGGNAARVGLVFKIPMGSSSANAMNIVFSPASYLAESDAHELIREVIRNINKDYDFLHSVNRDLILRSVVIMLLISVTCLKHEAFREEREWRAIYTPSTPSPLMNSSIEVIGGIPQHVFKIPMDKSVDPKLADIDIAKIFDRLIIGPTSYPWVMYQSFVAALSAAGCQNANERVWVSDIPIRQQI